METVILKVFQKSFVFIEGRHLFYDSGEEYYDEECLNLILETLKI